MLPSAFDSLSDPCLPDFWTEIYDAAPGAIAMGAAVAIFLVEFFSTRYLAAADARIARKTVATSPNPSITTAEEKITPAEASSPSQNHFGHHHMIPPPMEGEVDASTAATQKLGVLVLEAGIIFHSVFIGLTLAVSTGSNFISLFITIIFHRSFLYYSSNVETFEGLALGSRIATLAFKSRDWRPYFLALLYALTTPMGIAIGLGIRLTYDPNSQRALISAGVFDSVSAGLLIYAAMVELLAHDFIHGEMRTAPLKMVLLAIGSLLVGCALMSLLGRWA
jgi:solute carrier family 39 (zinc transporter), member 1/2/3